jgi:uncharacterized protein (DUF4415 family)
MKVKAEMLFEKRNRIGDHGLRNQVDLAGVSPGRGWANRRIISARRANQHEREKHTVVRKRAIVKGGRTDWQRVSLMSEQEITRVARSDPDAQATDQEFWKDARIVLPQDKHPVTLRMDRDVLDWFKSHGPRYQSRINAVLRSYMEARRKVEASRSRSSKRQP